MYCGNTGTGPTLVHYVYYYYHRVQLRRQLNASGYSKLWEQCSHTTHEKRNTRMTSQIGKLGQDYGSEFQWMSVTQFHITNGIYYRSQSGYRAEYQQLKNQLVFIFLALCICLVRFMVFNILNCFYFQSKYLWIFNQIE